MADTDNKQQKNPMLQEGWWQQTADPKPVATTQPQERTENGYTFATPKSAPYEPTGVESLQFKADYMPQNPTSVADVMQQGAVNVANTHTSRPVTADFSNATGDEYDKPIQSLKDYLAHTSLETDEEKKKRERREKSKKIIAAIGDGLSALSNLYFTTQYAPSSYNPENSLTKSTLASIEKAKKDREKEKDRYMTAEQKLAELIAKRGKDKTDKIESTARANYYDTQAKAKADDNDRDAQLAGYKQREAKAKADKAEQDAIAAAIKANKIGELTDAQIAMYNRSHRGVIKSVKPNEYFAQDKNGKIHSFSTERAATVFARQNGTLEIIEVPAGSTTDYNRQGNVKGSQEKTKTVTVAKITNNDDPIYGSIDW